ncbi:flavodoxin family protein [Methanoculleus sp. FWC-SCC1]|uniref:Flavodoxin family protein n=1 Tax=Methanoculleus frigidifontis TaxID=2584085 RepID=A0ABT8MA14_9EURY|nr:flavodoxin family protein [Methanoculleus sp. FWC-SCC1]MDN7024749.1 flavodoxin family protein [Methanoculleus sp. FWC-SCC1]
MAKKIIALLGSPRMGGNTAKLLEQAIEGAQDAGCDVEKIPVFHLNFKPCMEIFHCMENEECKIKDDMTGMYQKFREMDSLIVAAPVMTMGIPGKLKMFMDRFQVFYMAKYFRNASFISPEHRKERKMLFISISGMNIPNVFEGAKITTKAFGEIIDCPYWDEVLQNDMDTIRDITTKPDVMKAAYEKGYRLGSLLMAEEERA